jgi:putative FmdB family regulatory protein
MPTYEYRCPNGHEFDRFYKTISGAPTELACAECNAMASRQLSGGAGLLFKGSGFYLTDYGKNAHRKSEPQKVEGQKAEGQKAESGKAEAKSETKSDAAKTTGGTTASDARRSADTPKKPKAE